VQAWQALLARKKLAAASSGCAGDVWCVVRVSHIFNPLDVMGNKIVVGAVDNLKLFKARSSSVSILIFDLVLRV
jgi:hypothetical protein